jgi:integrase/recombinase XerD
LTLAGPAAGADLAICVDAYLRESLVRGHSKHTVAYRRVHLRQLLEWLRERGRSTAAGLTPRVLADYVGHLAQRLTRHNRPVPTPLAGTTKAAAVSVVRSFGAWLAACEVLPANPAHDLQPGRWVAPIPKAVLTVAEVERLLETPADDTRGLRDRAILETLYSTGLRRAELCRLDLYDLDFCTGAVMIRQGKGGMDRVVPIGATALRALRHYSRESRPRLLSREDEPAVFLASITRRRLLPKTVNCLVRKYSEAAGLGKRVTPHLLRHTCMTHLLQGGASSEDVRAILGHVSVGTTHIYTRVTVEDLAAAHARHHPRENLRRP